MTQLDAADDDDNDDDDAGWGRCCLQCFACFAALSAFYFLSRKKKRDVASMRWEPLPEMSVECLVAC